MQRKNKEERICDVIVSGRASEACLEIHHLVKAAIQFSEGDRVREGHGSHDDVLLQWLLPQQRQHTHLK